MTIAYRDRRAPASVVLIERLEQLLGQGIPDAYRDYLLIQDGGWCADNDEVIKTIFGLGDVPETAKIWKKLDTYRGRVPVWFLPVANDAFGNLFGLSLRAEDCGSVWLWSHEEEADEGDQPTEDNLSMKAPDWSTFLERL